MLQSPYFTLRSENKFSNPAINIIIAHYMTNDEVYKGKLPNNNLYFYGKVPNHLDPCPLLFGIKNKLVVYFRGENIYLVPNTAILHLFWSLFLVAILQNINLKQLHSVTKQRYGVKAPL